MRRKKYLFTLSTVPTEEGIAQVRRTAKSIVHRPLDQASLVSKYVRRDEQLLSHKHRRVPSDLEPDDLRVLHDLPFVIPDSRPSSPKKPRPKPSRPRAPVRARPRPHSGNTRPTNSVSDSEAESH